MKTVKIKGNQYAELFAIPAGNDEHYADMHTRLRVTEHGSLFRELIAAAVSSGKFDSPVKLVEFCEIATNRAILTMGDNPALAIEAPPRSVIARKVAKANSKKDTDNV